LHTLVHYIFGGLKRDFLEFAKMQAAEPATYDLLVKVYNYRYGTGKWLQQAASF